MSPGSIRPRSWAEWPQTPGVAVGLELEAHRQLVGLLLARALLGLAHLGAGAEEVLHVVPELVGEHVHAGEVAGRVELALRAA